MGGQVATSEVSSQSKGGFRERGQGSVLPFQSGPPFFVNNNAHKIVILISIGLPPAQVASTD